MTDLSLSRLIEELERVRRVYPELAHTPIWAFDTGVHLFCPVNRVHVRLDESNKPRATIDLRTAGGPACVIEAISVPPQPTSPLRDTSPRQRGRVRS